PSKFCRLTATQRATAPLIAAMGRATLTVVPVRLGPFFLAAGSAVVCVINHASPPTVDRNIIECLGNKTAAAVVSILAEPFSKHRALPVLDPLATRRKVDAEHVPPGCPGKRRRRSGLRALKVPHFRVRGPCRSSLGANHRLLQIQGRRHRSDRRL